MSNEGITIRKRSGETYKVLVDDEDFEWIKNKKWHMLPNGYACTYHRKDNGKLTTSYLHREIMNTPKGFETDHINRNKLDNRKENLRVVENKKNKENVGNRKDNKSGHKGVHFCKASQKWLAYIMHNKKWLYLGRYQRIEDAIFARKNKEQELNWSI